MNERDKGDRHSVLALGLMLLAIVLVTIKPSFNTGDTLAQWIAAIASVASAVVSVFAVLWVRKTFHETKESNKIFQGIGHMQTRAYLYAREFVWTGNDFVLIVKNGGETPAKEFYVRQVIRPTDQLNGSWNFPIQSRYKSFGSLGQGEEVPIKLSNEEEQNMVIPRMQLQRGGDARFNFSFFECVGTIKYKTIHDAWFETDFAFHQSGNALKSNPNRPFSRMETYGLRAFEELSQDFGPGP